MPSKSATIDFDLDDFDMDDIIDHLRETHLTVEEKKRLKELLDWGSQKEEMGIETLDDQLKFDHLCEVFDKYTVTQIETALPK